MKAIVIKKFGDVSNLQMKNIKAPEPNFDEVLVKVSHIGISPYDCLSRVGGWVHDHIKLPTILGWEISGTIEVAPNASKFKVGDKVCGLINFPGRGSAYSEYLLAKEGELVHVPEAISLESAAAIPLAGLSTLQSLRTFENLEEGSRILILGAASGIGHLAVQLLKAIDVYIVGTAKLKDRDYVKSIGVDKYIDFENEDFTEFLDDIDYVLDCEGGEVGRQSVAVLNNGGSIISLPNGVQPEWVANRPDVKCLDFSLSPNTNDLKEIMSLIVNKEININIDEVFPFNKMGDAHIKQESGGSRGKVIVSTKIKEIKKIVLKRKV